MGRLKEALLIELLLQLLKGHMEVSHPVGGEGGAVELILSVPGKDRHPAKGQHLHAVLRPEAQRDRLPPEHDAPDGPSGVLEGKIVVA